MVGGRGPDPRVGSDLQLCARLSRGACVPRSGLWEDEPRRPPAWVAPTGQGGCFGVGVPGLPPRMGDSLREAHCSELRHFITILLDSLFRNPLSLTTPCANSGTLAPHSSPLLAPECPHPRNQKCSL